MKTQKEYKCSCGQLIPVNPCSTIKAKRCSKCEYEKAYLAVKGRKPPEKKANGKNKNILWKNKGLSELIQYLQDEICNPYIRERDQTNYGVCISSKGRISDAGHFFPTSTHPGMRFSVQNVHGQSSKSNRFQGGDLTNYCVGLIERHGEEYLNELRALEIEYKHNGKKFDCSELIEIGIVFKVLRKNKIWVYRQEVFESYMVKLRNNVIF